MFAGGLLGKNRDRLGIVVAILEAASSRVTKTRIMLMANFSYELLEKYLGVALDSGLVQARDCQYSLTENGRDFLKQYRHLNDRYVEAQKLLATLNFERNKLSLKFGE